MHLNAIIFDVSKNKLIEKEEKRVSSKFILFLASRSIDIFNQFYFNERKFVLVTGDLFDLQLRNLTLGQIYFPRVRDEIQSKLTLRSFQIIYTYIYIYVRKHTYI